MSLPYDGDADTRGYNEWTIGMLQGRPQSAVPFHEGQRGHRTVPG